MTYRLVPGIQTAADMVANGADPIGLYATEYSDSLGRDVTWSVWHVSQRSERGALVCFRREMSNQSWDVWGNAATQPLDDAECDAAIAAIEAALIEPASLCDDSWPVWPEDADASEGTDAPVMVPQQVQQQQANAGDGVPVYAQPWVCRRCGAAQHQPDAVWQGMGGRYYRAPCCGPCGQYFSAEDIARYDVAPAMVPQQCQQQQACAAPLYAFQVRGERTHAAPVAPQDVEGITPRAVVAQTVHVRTRADWYAFSRACRTVARNRVEARNAGESIFWAMIGGRVHRLTVARHSFGMMQRPGGAWRRTCHGTPVALSTARLTERPRRALIAAELDWAAKYRGNAMRDARDRNAHRRAMSVKAVRACIAEARGLGSAFDRLPG